MGCLLYSCVGSAWRHNQSVERASTLQRSPLARYKHHRQQLSRLRVTSQLEPEAEAFRELREMPTAPKKTARLEPNFYLSAESAVEVQLKALQHNNFPTTDAGIECLYRFAAFDPFARSRYFGRSLDLGQFERFRRIFYTPCYQLLLNHTKHEILSKLEVSEHTWKARVLVSKQYYVSTEEHVYEFTMTQRFGGKRDGYWFTDSLICDGCDDRHVLGVI